MRVLDERSAGVIPYRLILGSEPLYLVIHSAMVRNPRARWEFPKGGIELHETRRQAAAREFEEETGLVAWTFRDGFEASLSYSYNRDGWRRFKTVTYFLVEVFDDSTLTRSHEHVEDLGGRWFLWDRPEGIEERLSRAKIRRLFRTADAWLRTSVSSAPRLVLDNPEPENAIPHTVGITF
jgi:8-oxo-dGTP pyrophosphatase MutT (NUDIX family)